MRQIRSFVKNSPLAQWNIARTAIFSIVTMHQKTVKPLHETARYKTQQAVIEWGWDAKIGERRGGDF
jgi:hypothetical protein